MRLKIKVDLGTTDDMIKALLRLDGAKRGLRAAGLYLQGKLGEYPPQPANVRYMRTGDLRRGWTSKPENGGLTVRVGNNVPYADDVQGRQSNPYFARVWRAHSIRSVVQRETNRVTEIIFNEIRRSIP